MNGIVSVNIMGGLGNQLFQLACAYAYAKKNNSSLLILRHKRMGGQCIGIHCCIDFKNF